MTSNDPYMTFDHYLCTNDMKHGSAILLTKLGCYSLSFGPEVAFTRFFTK